MFVLTLLLHQEDCSSLWNEYFPGFQPSTSYLNHNEQIKRDSSKNKENYIICDCCFSKMEDTPVYIFAIGLRNTNKVRILIAKSEFKENFVKPYSIEDYAPVSTIGFYGIGDIVLHQISILNTKTDQHLYKGAYGEGTAYFTLSLQCTVNQIATSYCDPNYNGGSTVYNYAFGKFDFTSSNVTSNNALHQAGYQLNVKSEEQGKISCLILKNNTSKRNNVCSNKGNILIKNSVFTRNNLVGDGSSIIEADEKGSTLTISNCFIANNNDRVSISNKNPSFTVIVEDSIVDSRIDGVVQSDRITNIGLMRICDIEYIALPKPTEVYVQKRKICQLMLIFILFT